MNPGPPAPRALEQRRSGERPFPGEPGWHATIPRQRAPQQSEPTLVLTVDLGELPPDVEGGVVTRVWLLLRLGSEAVGQLLVPVPEKGLTSAEVGALIAARVGARRRRAADGQPRSRSRGSTSSL